MKLIVGLGNPGRKYAGTRHNVGFEVIAELARRHGSERPRSRFHGEILETAIEYEKTILLCPLTYMNASGQSVREAVDFYKLSLDDLLVICDDLNLPTGRLRLRPGGSAGGQNGIKDIIRCLGSQQFSRLRLGIDRPPPRWDPSDYVLGKFDEEQSAVMEQAIPRAANAAERWVAKGIQTAMNEYNENPDAPPRRKQAPQTPAEPRSRAGTRPAPDAPGGSPSVNENAGGKQSPGE